MLKVLYADCWEMELCSKILCADYARLGFYYARHYAQHYARAAFIMRGFDPAKRVAPENIGNP